MDSVKCAANYVLVLSRVEWTNESVAEDVTFCNISTSQKIRSTFNCFSTKDCLLLTKKRVQSNKHVISKGTGDRDDDYASLILTAGTSFHLIDCCKNSIKQCFLVQNKMPLFRQTRGLRMP
jgi:hypothetical protein